MKALWAKSPRTTQQLTHELEPATRWKLKTVLTLLNRLVVKGAVDYEKRGKAHHYFPLLAETETCRAENHSFLQRVYNGSFAPMLAHFVEHAELTPAQIQELKDILDGKEKRK
jgi:BlaI family penicillinase repressor